MHAHLLPLNGVAGAERRNTTLPAQPLLTLMPNTNVHGVERANLLDFIGGNSGAKAVREYLRLAAFAKSGKI